MEIDANSHFIIVLLISLLVYFYFLFVFVFVLVKCLQSYMISHFKDTIVNNFRLNRLFKFVCTHEGQFYCLLKSIFVNRKIVNVTFSVISQPLFCISYTCLLKIKIFPQNIKIINKHAPNFDNE